MAPCRSVAYFRLFSYNFLVTHVNKGVLYRSARTLLHSWVRVRIRAGIRVRIGARIGVRVG